MLFERGGGLFPLVIFTSFHLPSPPAKPLRRTVGSLYKGDLSFFSIQYMSVAYGLQYTYLQPDVVRVACPVPGHRGVDPAPQQDRSLLPRGEHILPLDHEGEPRCCTDKKEKKIFLMYLRTFRWERLQSHI